MTVFQRVTRVPPSGHSLIRVDDEGARSCTIISRKTRLWRWLSRPCSGSAESIQKNKSTRPDTTYKSDFDEDTLIISETVVVRLSKREKFFKRRNRPSLSRPRLSSPLTGGGRFLRRKIDGPKRPAS